MRSLNRMRFALSTLLLLVTLFGLTIALWLEWTRKPEILYLHLYSNRYDISHPVGKLPPPPRDWECIATISMISGAPFYADIPCHDEPMMILEGTVVRRGNLVGTNFTIEVSGVDVAYRHKQNSPVPLNRVHDFSGGWGSDFKFAISDTSKAPLVVSPTRTKQ